MNYKGKMKRQVSARSPFGSQMDSKLLLYAVAVVAIVLGSLLGWQTMNTPEVWPADMPGLSAERMADHLNIVAAERRSELQFERRMYVRDYIIQTMADLGLIAEVDDFEIKINTYQEYILFLAERFQWSDATTNALFPDFDKGLDWHQDLAGTVFRGSNVLFRMQGRNDTAIMLIAHIDSIGLSATLHPDSDHFSYGAADAGYGIVTMLEIARFYAEHELENSIYFLVTDLHEIGLFGAYQALDNMDFSNVSIILNLEGRGIRGPVYMFETHAGNLEALRFFRNALSKTDAQPMSYSFAVSVYRLMPNNTDLTLFLNRGFSGMNFAPMNNLLHYHTPDDSLEHISLTTMQHYVNTIGALVEEFVTNPQYGDIKAFLSDRSAVYFVLPFQVLILYSDIIALIKLLFMLAASLALAFYLQRKQALKLLKCIKWMILLLCATLVTAIVGFLISFAVSLITDIPFDPVWMPLAFDMYIIWPSVLAGVGLLGLLHWAFVRRFNRNEMAIGAILLLLMLTILLQLVMVEATVLTFISLITTFGCFVLSYLAKVKRNKYLPLFCVFASIVIITTILVPILTSVALALTIGGLGIMMPLAIIMCMGLPALLRDDSIKDVD